MRSSKRYLPLTSGRPLRVTSYFGASWWLTLAPGCMFLPRSGGGAFGGGDECAPLRPPDLDELDLIIALLSGLRRDADQLRQRELVREVRNFNHEVVIRDAVLPLKFG